MLMQLLICTRTSESRISPKLVPLLKNKWDVKLHSSVLILQVFLTGNKEWSHTALKLNQGKCSLHHVLMALCPYCVNTVILMFLYKVIQATGNFRGFILAMGKIFYSFRYLVSYPSLEYQASYLTGLFSSVISETEEGRKRPQRLISAFTVIQVDLSMPGPVHFSPSSWSER